MSALWDPIFGRTALSAVTGDQAWLSALCEAEGALARACATAGLIDPTAATRITSAAAEVARMEPGRFGAAAAGDGNPVIALVRALRAEVGAAHAPAVHLGATSQDIMDTATMLIVRRALTVLVQSLSEAAQACAQLARAHRDTAIAGRTLLQQAVPTSFGAIAAGWGEGLDRVLTQLRSCLAALAVQLGGAAGTLAGWYPNGPTVRSAFATELGLVDPGTVWHTERSRVADIAAILGTSCGVIAKIATDVLLLAQTELGEVTEGAGGASSTMAHKHNPIAAITARAAAAQAPGLVATLLCAMPAELQRGAGPWHAEWPALGSLLQNAGGAAHQLVISLSGLQINPAAMAHNMQQLPGFGQDVGHAGDLVDHYLSKRPQ